MQALKAMRDVEWKDDENELVWWVKSLLLKRTVSEVISCPCRGSSAGDLSPEALTQWVKEGSQAIEY